jgi:hypothetical protein
VEGISQEITAAQGFFAFAAPSKATNREDFPVNFPDSKGSLRKLESRGVKNRAYNLAETQTETTCN